MIRKIRQSFLLVLLTGMTLPSLGLAGKIVRLSTDRGSSQYFYEMKNHNAVATVILFIGGKGKLRFDKKGTRKLYKSNNFLARTRQLFKHQKLNVVVIDAPTDQQGPDGMFYGFRATAAHAHDVALVVRYARTTFSKPVWLIGTSRGTESVANAAIRLGNKIDGIVLTASMTEPNRKGTAVSEMNVKKIAIPVQIVSHTNDKCHVTTPHGSKRLFRKLKRSPRTELKMVSGGDAAISKPCKARSAHGFLGIEKQVVTLIGEFIRR